MSQSQEPFPIPNQNFKATLPGWVYVPHYLLADDFDLEAEETLRFAALNCIPDTAPGLPQRSTTILYSKLTTLLQGASWSPGVLLAARKPLSLPLIPALPAQCPGLPDSGKEGCLRQGPHL
jgi:hypothetical protein